DRVEDALNATKLAVSDGVVAGGGIALLRISKSWQTSNQMSNCGDWLLLVIRDYYTIHGAEIRQIRMDGVNQPLVSTI
ncbi:MAG: hypothetical protein ACTS7I_02585, partial [Candidatus Hodgkinia cicadicola]